MKTALVLGAGGTVGLAYHAGALRALERHAGVVAGDADLIVGTSAGAIIGAYLRAGWTSDDLWQVAMKASDEAPDGIFTPSFTTPIGLARRALGTGYVLARSVVRLPGPRVPAALQRAFPAGMFLLAAGRRRLKAELPPSWPARPLWLCTVDLNTGRRVVLGEKRRPRDLHSAVLASCAIPGIYEPVRIGERTLVDGGLHSSTNLDLVVRPSGVPYDRVICIAPMAFDTAQPPGPALQLMRRLPARQLAAEAAPIRRAGVSLLLVRPTAREVRLHGASFMRLSGWDRIAEAAYESTSRLLETRSVDQGRGSTAATTL
jgi:NTE family protein